MTEIMGRFFLWARNLLHKVLPAVAMCLVHGVKRKQGGHDGCRIHQEKCLCRPLYGSGNSIGPIKNQRTMIDSAERIRYPHLQSWVVEVIGSVHIRR
jgi:hypothetical protein